jgi:hypothetical protein
MLAAKTIPFPVPGPYQELSHTLQAAHIGRGVDGGLAAYEAALADDLDGRRKPIALPWPSLGHTLGDLWAGLVTILFGVAGHAKSWMGLNILYKCIIDGVPAKMLALEDAGEMWLTRLLAIHTGFWDVLKRDDSGNRLRAELFTQHRGFMETALPYICENPRKPLPNGTVGDVDYENILSFVQDEIEAGVKLIIVDPVSMITFSDDGRSDYAGQAVFIQRLVGIVANSTAHMILVAHAAKVAGPGRDLQLEGSDRLRRFSQNVLRLEKHETIESPTFGIHPVAEHDMTLTAVKIRNGMTGTKVAMRFSDGGPRLIDCGMLKPKGKKS